MMKIIPKKSSGQLALTEKVQYLTDFGDFGVAEKLRSVAFQRHQNHQNPLGIDPVQGLRDCKYHAKWVYQLPKGVVPMGTCAHESTDHDQRV